MWLGRKKLCSRKTLGVKKISLLILWPLLSFPSSLVREKLSELHKLRSEIRKSVFEKSRTDAEIRRAQLEMQQQLDKIAGLNQEVAGLRDKMSERVSFLYKTHRLEEKGALFQLTGGHDFLKKAFYLNYLNNQDLKIVSEFKTKEKTILKEQKKYKARVVHFENLQKKSKKRYAELLKSENAQRQIIAAIKNDIKSSKETQPQQNFFSEKRGFLKLPALGAILNEFGLMRDKLTNLNHLNTGIYIRANQGVEVQSVGAGEVLHAEWVPGWGFTIIVDHGEFYYSIYSGLKDPSVRLGDRVLDHQKLAVVGNQAYDKNSGLYFEIRHFSEPQNPSEWLEKEAL